VVSSAFVHRFFGTVLLPSGKDWPEDSFRSRESGGWWGRRNVGSFWGPTAPKSRQTGTHGAWKYCRQHRLPQG
jgi:hypothetical protein